MPAEKPVLAIKFKGCVAQNYDKEGFVVAGFFDWAVEAYKKFKLAIYSDEIPSAKMEQFVKQFLVPWRHERLAVNHVNAKAELKFIYWETLSESAFLMIDDHAITFTGRWSAPFLNPDELVEFKPGTETNVLYKLPDGLGTPDAAQRNATVAPPPGAGGKCPRHPWMTQQLPDGSRVCSLSTCGWHSPAPE